PTVRAAAELSKNDSAAALQTLETTREWEPAAGFWTHYLRGQADLKLGKSTDAAVEFREILLHSGEAPLSILYPLARLGLAPAVAQTGDRAGAITAYHDFMESWKDADPDLAPFQSARTEFAKVK